MTKDEIRIAIAEERGWTKLDKPKRLNAGFLGWFNSFWQSPQQRGSSLAEREPPNYPEDLNAMHEVEKTLFYKDNEADSYIRYLHCILHTPMPFESISLLQQWPIVHVTAAQRAEAYLRVKGLWNGPIFVSKDRVKIL